jgi:6-pyruvoyltetrahydropterin/6-carboxytetrahydropterin synthase
LISLTRRYRFPAAHVLRRPDFSEEENRRVYGKCANPNGHGHDYALEVTLAGAPDPRDGRLVDPAVLDAVVAEAVLRRLSHRMLNEDPLFAERVPTAENVAIVAHELLAAPLAERTGARLHRVRVRETRNNTFDYGDLR